MSRSIHQPNLVSLASVSSDVTFSHCPPVCKTRSKRIHLSEPRSLKQKRAGLSELQDQAVLQQHLKERAENANRMREGASISGRADPEQGHRCPENRRANLLAVLPVVLTLLEELTRTWKRGPAKMLALFDAW